MKRNFYLLLITVLVIAAGCTKTETSPPILPEGTFTGVFTRLHYSTKTNKIDTASANIVLTLSSATGYTVTGDTTVLHAGSHGSYVVDGSNMQCIDKILLPNTPLYPGKVHLAGIYAYSYSGTSLKIGANNDTLSFYYNLQRQ